MHIKKVLIITYYWPPSGGSGVQRWLKFTKYLRDFNWEPVIYTPENPEIPVEDSSLMKDIPEGITVLKKKIWEPYSFYKKFLGQKAEDKIQTGFLTEKRKPKRKEKISVWIRGNLFIPDARKFWIRPSVKYLATYLKKNPVDIIISTGPPHSMHLIALGLKKRLNIPWLADFRDPWTNIDFYKDLKLTRWADNHHHKFEQQVLNQANLITTVSWNWANEFRDLGAENIEVITNGYDPDDFKGLKIKPDTRFVITHIGSMNKDRNPIAFWQVLANICIKNKEFKQDLVIRLIGNVDISVWENIKEFNLKANVKHINHLNHPEVIKHIKKSQILLLPLNNTPNVSGIIPGKIFEYLAAKRFILVIGPTDGDAAQIVNNIKAGKVFGFENYSGLKNNILALYHDYKKGNLQISAGDISGYSRKNLTEKLAKLLNALIK